MMESLATVTVGTEAFPMRSEGRCKTCAHPRRPEIERELARGRGYTHVVRSLGLGQELTAENLSLHVKNGHLPVIAPAVRAVVQERAEEVLEAAQPLAASLASHLMFAQQVVDRVRQRLESGNVEPSIADGLAAAKLLASSSAGAQGADVAEMEAYLIQTVETVKQVMTSDQVDEFNRRMQRWIATRPRLV